MSGGLSMEIYLIRHAKSEKSGGGQKNTGLSELGQKQAKKIGRFLAGKPIKRVYTSPLQRASITAKYIADNCQAPLISTSLLMERTHGILDGLTEEERKQTYPIFYRQLKENPLLAMPGGESYEDVKRRVETIYHRIVQQEKKDACIALVSHGEWLNIFMHTILHLNPTLYPAFHFKTSSYSLIQIKGDRIQVRYLNRTNHL